MFNSQYYTCEQVDERLLQGYLDDYNSQTGQSLTKEQFLTKLGDIFAKETVIDNIATQIGYYECDTAAGTAAKAITVADYALFAGGSMKVKFANKNTADNATLNINSQGAKALYYGGKAVSASNSWDNNEIVEIYYDGTSYYANNVEGNFKDGIFDISAYNLTEGQPTKYATLAEALGTNGNNVPLIFRKGGMQIKYVSTSDNKYVQYRLMSQTFSTTESNWQGVDDEPADNSNNFAKSGGIAKYKSYNYTKNDYTNSLVKEIHIEGQKISGLKYFVRGCMRYRILSGQTLDYFYFAIQSYNPTTQERETICEFSLGANIKTNGIYTVANGDYTTTILVTLDNRTDNTDCVRSASYSENLEINDICWGDAINAPLIKALTWSGEVANISIPVLSSAVYTALMSTSLLNQFKIYNTKNYGADYTETFLEAISHISLADRVAPCIVLHRNNNKWGLYIYRGYTSNSDVSDAYWLNSDYWTDFTAESSGQSTQYTKNRYTNSLVKEIHIQGTKNPNLKYFVRGCMRYRIFQDQTLDYFYFAIQSYDLLTETRETVCEFAGASNIKESGVYSVTNGDFITTILVMLDDEQTNDGCVRSADYSEDLEITDICWGNSYNAPLIKALSSSSGGASSAYTKNDYTNSLVNEIHIEGKKDANLKYFVRGCMRYREGSSSLPGYGQFYFAIQSYDPTTQERVTVCEFTNIHKSGVYADHKNGFSTSILVTLENNSSNIGMVRSAPYSEELEINDICWGEVSNAINANNYLGIHGSDSKHVDLIIFMGQSNMAGRGITNEDHPDAAPNVVQGAGYEFRAITDPTVLYPITEPFGVNENNANGIDDGTKKTGSMVSAFVNAYYKTTGKTIVGVSASKGGTTSNDWQPGGVLLPDAIQRFTDAVTFLTENGYIIDRKYMVWCQGESDGDDSVSASTYKSRFRNILNAMEEVGVEKCFVVRIGKYNGTSSTNYSTIINAQSDLCRDNDDVIMASTALASFKEKGLMKDSFHYYQDAYNIVGAYSGRNVGLYREYGISKPQYDVMTNSIFYTNKDY